MPKPVPVTFITVVYDGDYGLMRLQARSLCKYLDPRQAAEIVVIENAPPSSLVPLRPTLLNDYGQLAAKVRFIEGHQIAAIPASTSGWFSQQILKLMAAGIVRTRYYVVLDGKNHLLRPLPWDFLITASGKPRSYLVSYEFHSLRRFFENTLPKFGLDPQRYLKAFLPTHTPFVFPTTIVRALVAEIEFRARRSFPEAFLYAGHKHTEFFLFGSYLLTRLRFGDVYDLSGPREAAIWPESSMEHCAATMAYAEACRIPFFAVHRRAFPRLSPQIRGQLAQFWHRHGLFPSTEAALQFLASPLTPPVPDSTDDPAKIAAAYPFLLP